MRSREELFGMNLPKWPQMIVTGKSIPVSEALEIIRRTDRFFYCCLGGNNHRFNEKAKSAIHFPKNTGPFDAYWKATEWWRENWSYIDCNYVLNDWVSCAFVKGPHGWCHPDGTIGFIDNVGKWPAVEEVYNDWVKLATAFPILEVEVTLMDGEECEEEIRPVVSFLVRDSKVEIVDPEERDIHQEFGREIMKGMTDEEWDRYFSYKLHDFSSENAIPIEQIELWGSAFVERVGGLPWEKQ